MFSADEVETRAAKGEDVILVRIETSPEDVHGMHAARGVLTTRGGMTSHAAVVARGMGRACVAGAGGIRVDYGAQTLSAGGHVLKAGDWITLDGSTGEVFAGRVATVQPTLSGDFSTLMGWADGVRRLRVRANAETPTDAATAARFGAEGIGLCRTEHMFFAPERIGVVRRMIMAEDATARARALDTLLPFQRDDFAALFRIMAGLPVTIRLLDPPLHEFLPHTEAELAELASGMSEDLAAVRQRHAACPRATRCWATAAAGSASPSRRSTGCRRAPSSRRRCWWAKRPARPVSPEIMIPLVGSAVGAAGDAADVEAVAREVVAGSSVAIDYTVGTMIELPRAALTADQIAAQADFFSFGTNDLTQTTFGLSRDDAGSFLPHYVEHGSAAEGPVRHPRSRRRRRAGADRGREGPRREARPQARHLRRARRRPGLDRVLRGGRPRLRVLLAFPGADRPPGRSPSGAGPHPADGLRNGA